MIIMLFLIICLAAVNVNVTVQSEFGDSEVLGNFVTRLSDKEGACIV